MFSRSIAVVIVDSNYVQFSCKVKICTAQIYVQIWVDGMSVIEYSSFFFRQMDKAHIDLDLENVQLMENLVNFCSCLLV
jgi:hypothetical protein